MAGRRARRRRWAPRQTSRKDTSRVIDYRIRRHTAELSPLLPRMKIRYRLRSLCWARMLVRCVEHEMPTRRSGANMNGIAATRIIRERLRQRLLSRHEAWRCQTSNPADICATAAASVSVPRGHRTRSTVRQASRGSPSNCIAHAARSGSTRPRARLSRDESERRSRTE